MAGYSTVEEEMRRSFVVPVEGDNVACAENGAKMVNAGMVANVLNGDLIKCTFHRIGKVGADGSQEGIRIALRDNFMLNRIKFLLPDIDDRSYSYFLEVSLDGKDWTRIRDYTKYACRSWQLVSFPKTIVRFIKIVGTHNSVNYNFHVITIRAYYFAHVASKFQVNRKWNLLGLMVPKMNVAASQLGANVVHGAGGNNMINGDTRRRRDNYTQHALRAQPILLQLTQPFVLDSMRLLLWDNDDRIYSYEINVSTDMVNWKTIARRQNERSWQNVMFEPLPVVFVRIMGIINSANDYFQVIHFECPNQAVVKEVEA